MENYGFSPNTLKLLVDNNISPKSVSDFFERNNVDVKSQAVTELIKTTTSIKRHKIYDIEYNVNLVPKMRGIGIKSQKSHIEFMCLMNHEFVDTNYDMRIGDDLNKDEFNSAEDLAKYIFDNFPLIGEYEFDSKNGQILRQLLNTRAIEVFNKLLNAVDLTNSEKDVITLEMVLAVRSDEVGNEETDDTDTNERSSFWEKIFLHFGYSGYDNKEYQYLRSKCVKIVKNTFERHKRYIGINSNVSNFNIPSTPMKLHALHPKKSVFALFNILLDFYFSELNCKYVENDTKTYVSLSKSLQNKLNDGFNNEFLSEEERNRRLRSDIVMCGFKALFHDRCTYGAMCCEDIIRKTDALLHDDKSLINPKASRWDKLLLEWFESKGAETTLRKRELQSRREEKIVTATEKIRIGYTFDSNRGVMLSMPSGIRLGGKSKSVPEISISVNGSQIIKRQLESSCGEITTVRPFDIPLDELAKAGADLSREFNIELNIYFYRANEDGIVEFDDYCSGDKLKKKYLVFDETGKNTTIDKFSVNDTVCLAYPSASNLQIDEVENKFKDGKIIPVYSFDLLDNSAIFLDGESVFRGASTRDSFVSYPSVERIDGISVISGDDKHSIFPEPFDVVIQIPESLTNLHTYRVRHEGNDYSLEQLCGGSQSFTLKCTQKIGQISVYEFASEKPWYPLRYAIVDDFEFCLDKPLYLYGEDICKLRIGAFGEHFEMLADIEDDKIGFEFYGQSFVADIPIVRCELNGKNAFEIKETVWHENISYEDKLTVSVPKGMTAVATINGVPLRSGDNNKSFEIGGFCTKDKIGSLQLKVDKMTIDLFNIAYSPVFVRNPLKLELGKIIWQPESGFVGPSDSALKLELTPLKSSERKTFRDLTVKDCELDCPELSKNGWIDCCISVADDNVFAGNDFKEIFKERLPLGNKDAFRFDGKMLHLVNYRYYDIIRKQIVVGRLHHFTGYLTNIDFTNVYSTPPNIDSDLKFPQYEARIKYYNKNSDRYIEYGASNPVLAWVGNDNIIYIAPCKGVDEPSFNINTDNKRIDENDGVPVDNFTYMEE